VLTDREQSVLALMAEGLTNPVIAERMHLSVYVSSVEKHIGSVFTKLDLAEEPSMNRRVAAVLTWLNAR